MVFLQACLIGRVVREPKHCGLQMDSGILEKRVILEQPRKVYIAPDLRYVLSLLEQTGSTMMVMSGWLLKEMQICTSIKV